MTVSNSLKPCMETLLKIEKYLMNQLLNRDHDEGKRWVD